MDYVAEQLSVYNSIKEDGTWATLDYVVRSAYNGTLDSFATTTTEYGTYVILTNCLRSDFGEQVMQGEKTMLVPAHNLPRLDQLETTNSFTFRVKTRVFTPKIVKVVEPDTTALLYKIKVTG